MPNSDKESASPGDLKGQPAPASVKEAERRSTSRHAFMAEAEVLALRSGVRFSSRISDLGPGGCFVDTIAPLPIGTKVQVIVRQGKTQLDTEGLVVYSQAGLGMGVAFDELGPGQRMALNTWLGELTDEHRLAQEAPPAPKEKRPARSNPDNGVVVKLVQLMVKKGLLTELDAKSLFIKPPLE
jgi:hypothetical protein